VQDSIADIGFDASCGQHWMDRSGAFAAVFFPVRRLQATHPAGDQQQSKANDPAPSGNLRVDTQYAELRTQRNHIQDQADHPDDGSWSFASHTHLSLFRLGASRIVAPSWLQMRCS